MSSGRSARYGLMEADFTLPILKDGQECYNPNERLRHMVPGGDNGMKIRRIHNGETTALAIEGDLDRQGTIKLRRAFDIVGNRDQSLVLDFHQIGMVGMMGLACLEQEAARRQGKGGALHAVRIPARLQELFRLTDLSKKIEIDPFEDESVFAERENVPLRPEVQWDLSSKIKHEKCPQCKAVLRPGAHCCMECGQTVHRRRADRHAVALPLLYRVTGSEEFTSGPWSPAITDDIDLKRFSGVGFYASEPFEVRQEMHILFPTLQPPRTESSYNLLVVFRGRVKNQIQMGEHYRAGLALFDYYEYEGAWEVKVETPRTAG